MTSQTPGMVSPPGAAPFTLDAIRRQVRHCPPLPLGAPLGPPLAALPTGMLKEDGDADDAEGRPMASQGGLVDHGTTSSGQQQAGQQCSERPRVEEVNQCAFPACPLPAATGYGTTGQRVESVDTSEVRRVIRKSDLSK